MRYVIISLFMLGMVPLSGCSLNKFTANRTASLLEEGSKSFNEERDYEFARQAMPGSLKLMESLLKSSPNNKTVLSMLAQGYCSYAFGFLEDSGNPGDQARARALYRRGYEYGLRSLPDKVQENSKGTLEDFDKALAKLDEDEAPNLFWTSYCLGGWVNMSKNDVMAVSELPRVEMMMRKVLEKDEKFYNGGAHLFYGVYYGSRPKMLGGDPAKAKQHLERAITMTEGKFLMPKVFMAQFFAVPTQNETLFQSTLQEVLSAPDDLMPSEGLANQIAKKRAERLMKAQKDLF